MTREEILLLAAAHVASGKKIIFPMRSKRQPGELLRRWTASTVDGDAVITDQPLVVVREATPEEYLQNYPAAFGTPLSRVRPNVVFYEVTVE